MEIVYRETHANCSIEIYQESCPDSPDYFRDDPFFLIAGHRQFCVEKEGWDYRDRNHDKEKYFIAPIEAYIHSGVSLAFSYQGNFPDRQWDVSQVGYIVVDRIECGGDKPASDEVCKQIAESLLEEWNVYLDGRVFGYKVTHNKTGEEEICGGFYDKSWEGKESCLPEARSLAEALDKHVNKVSA